MMPATDTTPKRVVFIHADGMEQICGASLVKDLSVCIGPFTMLGREIPFASLYRVTTRAAYYKAPTIPTSAQTFHAEQK